MAEVCVDIDLRQIATDELVDELEFRLRGGDIEAAEIDLFGLSLLLGRLDCPDDIVNRIQEWEFCHVVTQRDLDKWVELTRT